MLRTISVTYCRRVSPRRSAAQTQRYRYTSSVPDASVCDCFVTLFPATANIVTGLSKLQKGGFRCHPARYARLPFTRSRNIDFPAYYRKVKRENKRSETPQKTRKKDSNLLPTPTPAVRAPAKEGAGVRQDFVRCTTYLSFLEDKTRTNACN